MATQATDGAETARPGAVLPMQPEPTLDPGPPDIGGPLAWIVSAVIWICERFVAGLDWIGEVGR